MDYFFELQLTLNKSLNYSETYFKLDSEEATHSHQLSLIVTLSVVCTLKGACQYVSMHIDVGGVEIHSIECIEYCTKDQAMSKMSKIDKVHIRGVMLCMFGKLTLCIIKHFEDVKDNLQHLQHASRYIRFDGMLESPKSQLSKTFFGLKIH